MSLFKVKKESIRYTVIPQDKVKYTATMDKEYSIMAKYYDFFMFLFPVWKKWIRKVLPLISGKKVLEVSFGPGYLMAQIAGRYEAYGIDFNDAMVRITGNRLKKKGLTAGISRGNVEDLAFEDESFDTVINTMAFTGYPDGDAALTEMKRVLKKGGRLLLVDFDYPKNRNIFGFLLVKFMEKAGDVIKDIKAHLERHDFDYEEKEIGGFGSVHLFIGTKK